jgi:hypothetical protein
VSQRVAVDTPETPAATASFRVLDTFTEAADEQVVSEIRSKTARALQGFDELAGKTVTIGRLDPDEDALGRAWFYNLVTLYPVDSTTPMMTVYHELAHLAIHIRRTRDEDVPITSEEFCSIFAVSRMPPEHIDRDRIAYLGYPDAPREEWPDICERALEYRAENGANSHYIQRCQEWLGVADAD